ncbi:hypothetical protein PRIPAC_81000 [Pristionchus pacificus]|nr:hypothetical protein PRIPAC_81000 [Pristionchus pacificus]
MTDKRFDIQGFRAWAVLAVVVFHFFPSCFPLGYLGVDVTKLRSALFALFFCTNYNVREDGEDYFEALEQASDYFTHFWSLSVEIQFYLVAPILLHMIKHKRILRCVSELDRM